MGKDGDLDAVVGVAGLDVAAGDIGTMDDGDIAVSTESASERKWDIGDEVEVGFADGDSVVVRVAATYAAEAIAGDALVTRSLWTKHNGRPSFFVAFIDLAGGVDLATGSVAVATAIGGPGGPEILDRDEFIEAEAAEVGALLNVIYGLLALAILIALMTIANTLSLSVAERTRELGLLRAVGQTRAQLRAMVRLESVIVATFGAIGGLGLGLFLGWGLVRAAGSSTTFATFAAPVGTMVIVLGAAVIAGVVAGTGPAWRASRMDVLTATTT